MFHGVGHREGLPKERPRPPSPSQLRIQLCNVRELQGSEAAHSGGGDGQTGGPRPAAEAAASRPPGCLAGPSLRAKLCGRVISHVCVTVLHPDPVPVRHVLSSPFYKEGNRFGEEK